MCEVLETKGMPSKSESLSAALTVLGALGHLGEHLRSLLVFLPAVLKTFTMTFLYYRARMFKISTLS